jgi:glutamate/tyrosine decarboxylase-like PLP-dependent enzyme
MDRLCLPPDDFRQLSNLVTELCTRYYEDAEDRPVIKPIAAQELHALLDQPLPLKPRPAEALLNLVEQVVIEYTRHHSHPRFFGYVASPGTAIAALGDLITSVINPNVTAWRSAPAPAELEHITIRWIAEMVGFPGTGLFVSGGSMANYCGLAAARARFAPKANARGLREPLRVYASEQVHLSITKAAAMLGIGRDNVRLVATDDRMHVDLAALELAIDEDKRAGLTPCCIVGSAGTAGTGAVDDLNAIADIATRHKLWFHVDGAYGGFAVMSHPHLFRGMERADSLSLDPHKWLYGPVGTGCILYRDPEAARAAFAEHAEYTRVMQQGAEAFAFWDYGPELSRRFRALPVWLLISFIGIEALREAIDCNIECAQHFESIVRAAPDFEMLLPVETSIFCFRYTPRGFTGDLNALNERVLLRLAHGGSSYLSNASVGGQFALRGCVLNYRTTRADMDQLLVDVRAAGEEELNA